MNSERIRAYLATAKLKGWKRVSLQPEDLENIAAQLEELERIKRAPDPLGEALNSGDGSYRP